MRKNLLLLTAMLFCLTGTFTSCHDDDESNHDKTITVVSSGNASLYGGKLVFKIKSSTDKTAEVCGLSDEVDAKTYTGAVNIPTYINYNNVKYSVTYIRNLAFVNCKITSVDIPSTVKTIASDAFCGCSCLTSITIPNSVTEIYPFAFDGCTGLTSVTIGNSVRWIGMGTFRDCTNLKTITIGKSVIMIETGAFMRCSGLKEIISLNTTPPRLNIYNGAVNYDGVESFDNVDRATCILKVPTSAVDAYKKDSFWKQFTNIVGI